MKSIERRAWLLALTGLVLLLCFSIACQDKAAMAELQHGLASWFGPLFRDEVLRSTRE
jgi:hypothetical protein